MAGVTVATARRPAAPWEAPVDLEGLGEWCRALAAGMPGVPLWVHAGLTMPPGGQARPDGWDRPSYLRAAVAATVESVSAGTPIAGFCYRDLGGAADRAGTGADAGLFAVTPSAQGDGVVWHDVDGTGAAAGATFRQLVTAVRAGDQSVLWGREALGDETLEDEGPVRDGGRPVRERDERARDAGEPAGADGRGAAPSSEAAPRMRRRAQ